MPLILSDESVNRYGFRVLTAGIKFIDNEIPMFYDHNHKEGKMPIGKFTNLRVENGELLADAVWDEDDQNAIEVKSKVEKGFIKGASIGFDIIETSIEPSLLLEGQTHATVTKCLLVEASPTAMRANIGARFLKYKGQTVTLSFDDNENIDLKNILPSVVEGNQTIEKMDNELLVMLGLASTATQKEVNAAVAKLNDDRVNALVELGKQKGVINATNENVYRLSAKADYAVTLNTLNAAPVVPKKDVTQETPPVTTATTPSDEQPITLSAMIAAIKSNENTQTVERLGAKFLRLSKEDDKELARIKRETPDVYAQMAKDYAAMRNG